MNEGDDYWDAELHQWVLIRSSMVPPFAPFLSGRIHNDKKARWPNGHLIKTSHLKTAVADVRPGCVVATENTRYLLILPARQLGVPPITIH